MIEQTDKERLSKNPRIVNSVLSRSMSLKARHARQLHSAGASNVHTILVVEESKLVSYDRVENYHLCFHGLEAVHGEDLWQRITTYERCPVLLPCS